MVFTLNCLVNSCSRHIGRMGVNDTNGTFKPISGTHIKNVIEKQKNIQRANISIQNTRKKTNVWSTQTPP